MKRLILSGHRGIRDFPFLPDHQRARIGEAAFDAKKTSVALQAADLLAYECFKHLDNRLFNPTIPERRSVSRLKKKISFSFPLDEPVLNRIVVEIQAFEQALKIMFPELI